jgi:hypothetical protein
MTSPITAPVEINIEVPLGDSPSPSIELSLQVTVTAERGCAAEIADVHLRQQDWNPLTRRYDETIWPFPADDWSQGLKARAIGALEESRTLPFDAADALEEAYEGEREAALEFRAELRREDRAAAE